MSRICSSVLIGTIEDTYNKKNGKTTWKIQSKRSDMKISNTEEGIYIQPTEKFKAKFLLMAISFL